MAATGHDPSVCPCNRCSARRADERDRPPAQEQVQPLEPPTEPPAEWKVLIQQGDDKFFHATARLRVPSGWLYREYFAVEGYQPFLNVTFVPDPS